MSAKLPNGAVDVNTGRLFAGEFLRPILKTGMDIYEIRRRRLKELLDSRFEGRQVDLARALSRPENYISRCLSVSTNKKNTKTIGEKFARYVEDTLGLPKLWLDQEGETVGAAIPAISAQALEIALRFETLSPDQRAALEAMLRAFSKDTPPDPPGDDRPLYKRH